MNCRRHGSKPTMALWMLVAIADVALLVAAGGLAALVLIVASLAVLAGGVVAARQLIAPRKVTNAVTSRDRRRA